MLKEGLGKGPYLKEQWYKIQKSASLLATRLSLLEALAHNVQDFALFIKISKNGDFYSKR